MGNVMRAWSLQVPNDAECPVEAVTVSNTGHIVIKLKGNGVHVVQPELPEARRRDRPRSPGLTAR